MSSLRRGGGRAGDWQGRGQAAGGEAVERNEKFGISVSNCICRPGPGMQSEIPRSDQLTVVVCCRFTPDLFWLEDSYGGTWRGRWATAGLQQPAAYVRLHAANAFDLNRQKSTSQFSSRVALAQANHDFGRPFSSYHSAHNASHEPACLVFLFLHFWSAAATKFGTTDPPTQPKNKMPFKATSTARPYSCESPSLVGYLRSDGRQPHERRPEHTVHVCLPRDSPPDPSSRSSTSPYQITSR